MEQTIREIIMQADDEKNFDFFCKSCNFVTI